MESDALEKSILSRRGDWEFDERVSLVFDIHVRKSIPCYNDIQELIGIISKKILSNDGLVYDLGTATGEVIRRIHHANPNRKIRYIGVDKSDAMIKKASEQCCHIKQAQFYMQDIESFKFKPAQLVVAAFTFQFIQPDQRQSVIQNIYEALLPGGHFMFCEKIIYDNANENNFYVDIHESWKQCHFSKEEIMAKKESLKHVMHPQTLNYNMELLKRANFRKVNLFFKWCNFVGIIAKK